MQREDISSGVILRRPFRDWYANIDKFNPLEDGVGLTDPMLRESLLEGLQTINSCSGDNVSMLRYSNDVGSEEACRMDITILHASSKIVTYGDILESQCSVYDSKMHYEIGRAHVWTPVTR